MPGGPNFLTRLDSREDDLAVIAAHARGDQGVRPPTERESSLLENLGKSELVRPLGNITLGFAEVTGEVVVDGRSYDIGRVQPDYLMPNGVWLETKSAPHLQ